MNAWFSKLRADGVIASGDTEIWITPNDGNSYMAAANGGKPIWAGPTLVFNVRNGTTNVGGTIIPSAYNEYQGSPNLGQWAGATNSGNGQVDRYEGVEVKEKILNATAPRFSSSSFGFLSPFQGSVRNLFIDWKIVATDVIPTWVINLEGTFYLYQVATGTYTRQIKNSLGQIVSIRDDEDPLVAFSAPDGSPWVMTNTPNNGVFIRPVYSYMGYKITGDLYYPDARVLNGQLRVVGSFSDGSPRFLWIDFSSERQDLRPVGTTEPPIEPPTKPPEPPIEPPTKPPKPPIEEQYYRVKEYKFMTPEIGAVRGPGNKFGRVTSAEAGKGMWGYYLVLFDRDTPDDDCWWEASKPDQYYQLQHTKLPIILGADSTEHSTDIPHEFYGKPISEGRGILESPVIIYDPIVGSLVPAYFCWPEKGTVGPAFAWVKR